MPDPTFSVIVPAYRSAHTITTTLRSLAAQTDPDHEVIVVDDGSPDDVAAVVEAAAADDPRIVLLRQPNRGPSAARNLALEHCRGELVSFLDSDDAWLPAYLEEASKAMASAPEAGLGFADAWAFRSADKRVHKGTTLGGFAHRQDRMTGDELLDSLLRINFITTSTVTATRAALEAAGGFSEDLDGAEDWDLWLRVAEAGYGAVRIGDSPLLLLRDQDTSLSKDGSMMALSAAEVLDRAGKRLPEGDPRRAAILGRAASARAEAGEDTGPGLARRLAASPVLRPLRDRIQDRLRFGPTPPDAARAFRALGETG